MSARYTSLQKTTNMRLNNINGYMPGSTLFNGGYLQVVDSPFLEIGPTTSYAFNFELWMKSTSSVANATLVGRDPSPLTGGYGWTGWAITMNYSSATAGDIGIQWNDGGQILAMYTTGVSVRDGNWHHIVINRTSSDYWQIWVDGTLRKNTQYNPSSMANDRSEGIRIGGSWYYGSGRSYVGSISNFRFAKTNTPYSGTFTPPNAPLGTITNTGILTCQNAGGYITDRGPYNLGITVSGSVSPSTDRPFTL